ncbi:hypothetical protein LSTR_LSTR011273 [Laodelphax striatellus]|uniref:N-acetyltransferase ESCO acetyl-transferase domain-containing protein n=1 Tax=Laodelphax striatellus TaxID=195883 RepID=A0A482XLW8_LAOST|nr:hypothetical protein LSTR_LSTR011273 [Laodelphax striatellus]
MSSSGSPDRTQKLSSRRSPYSRGGNTRDQEEFLRCRSRAFRTSSKTHSSTISSKSSTELPRLNTSLILGKDSVPSSSLTGSGVSERSTKSPRFSSTSSQKDTENRPAKTRARNSLFVQRDLLSSSPGESVNKEVSRKSSKSSHKESSSSSSTSNHPERNESDSRMELGDSASLHRITANIFEKNGSIYRPDRERKWFISGPRHYFRGDLNRVLKNSIIKSTEEVKYGRSKEIESERPEERFYEIKEPKETEETLKQRQLEKDEDEKILNEMEVEAEEINHKQFLENQTIICECDFPHPDYWSEQMIKEVHMNFYKIKHNDLKVTEEMLLLKNDAFSIVKLNMNENTPWTEKALQVIEFIDIELGYTDISTSHLKDAQVYMMLQSDLIVGCTVANKAQHGFRLVSKLEDQPMVSPTPEPILCGISRIWVLPKYRRNKFATLLLNSVKNYFMTEPLKMESIGFSDPSTLGRLFLACYMERSDFKVYFPHNGFGSLMNVEA